MKGRLFRFMVVGGVNTVATYAVYLALLAWLGAYWAYLASFIAGVFFSYLLNLKFTFRARHSTARVFSYALIYVAQFLLGISVLHLCLEIGVPEQLAPLFAIAVSVPVQFFLSQRLHGGGNGGGG